MSKFIIIINGKKSDTYHKWQLEGWFADSIASILENKFWKNKLV